MSLSYNQTSGELSHCDDLVYIIGVGYSGKGDGKNNSLWQNIPFQGPIPEGIYTIGSPFDSTTHGPHVFQLTPDPKNNMYGRSGFLIHGDSIKNPGDASEGCIVLGRDVRYKLDAFIAAGDDQLTVISGLAQTPEGFL